MNLNETITALEILTNVAGYPGEGFELRYAGRANGDHWIVKIHGKESSGKDPEAALANLRKSLEDTVRVNIRRAETDIEKATKALAAFPSEGHTAG